MKSLKQIVSSNITLARKRAGLTQAELAKKAHLTAVYVSRIEKGTTNLTIDSLEQISSALGVTPGQLFGDSGKPKPEIDREMEKSVRHVIKFLNGFLPKR